MKSKGASSILFNSSLDLRMMVVRFPQEKMAVKNPAISISCFLSKRCGTETGSAAIKESWLNSSTFSSRKSCSSFLFRNGVMLTNCLIQVFDQITGIFNTGTDADQVV